MAFDVTELDAACLGVGDDATLVTSDGTRPITVIISVIPDVDDSGGFQVMTDRTTAETNTAEIEGMNRGDTILQGGKQYKVLAWEIDATGWVVIELEEE